MTSISDLVNVMQKSIEIIESKRFDPILYQAIGLLYEYAGRHSGVTHQMISPTRPFFEKPELDDVIASGWLEEMTPPSEDSKQVVWKEALVVLTQKQTEDPCLWISREVMEGGGEPELETIHKIFIRRLHSCEYVNFYGDHRVSLRVKRKDSDIILRCQSAYAAREWVNELDAAKDRSKRTSILSHNHSSSWRERRKSEEKRVEKENKQKERKEKEIENLKAVEDSRRRQQIELEEQKKAAAEKRRIEIEQKRKIAQQEQKRMEAEKKLKFLSEEQRKQDLIANAKKQRGKSNKTESKGKNKDGEHQGRRSSLSAASKYQKTKQQQEDQHRSEVNNYSENKSPSSKTKEQHDDHKSVETKYTEMVNEARNVGEEFLTAVKRHILSQWALQPPFMQSLRPIEELLCSVHTAYPPACGVISHPYFTNWKVIDSKELTNIQGTSLEEEKLKKAVRKLRFFLHPDKLPRDLNEEQHFVCKLLWDVTNDAWDEYKRSQEESSLIS